VFGRAAHSRHPTDRRDLRPGKRHKPALHPRRSLTCYCGVALLPALAGTLLIGPVEVIGWRGVALPLLRRRFAPLRASLISWAQLGVCGNSRRSYPNGIHSRPGPPAPRRRWRRQVMISRLPEPTVVAAGDHCCCWSPLRPGSVHYMYRTGSEVLTGQNLIPCSGHDGEASV
jgi:hypothetical protein